MRIKRKAAIACLRVLNNLPPEGSGNEGDTSSEESDGKYISCPSNNPCSFIIMVFLT
jgi:hypothetical protein